VVVLIVDSQVASASNKDGLESSEKFSIDLSEIAFV
jgi:hypothetical protein